MVIFGVFGGDDVVVVGTGGEDLGDVGEVYGGGFDEGWSWVGRGIGMRVRVWIGTRTRIGN